MQYKLIFAKVLCCMALVLPFSLRSAGAEPDWQVRPDWAVYFDQAGVDGTIAILDQRQDRPQYLLHAAERAARRYSPASTFKVPHALFALDAGVVHDEFQVIKWDGEKRWLDAWNRDQDLRSSMRNSVVWVYQQFARDMGEQREREYLEKINYGNADPSGGVESFWLNGVLQISALEQIAFLRKLYHNELPFKPAHQRLVKDLIINEAGSDWILRAKTGWGTRTDPGIGWWVGWVEWPDGPVFFALNIDMPNGSEDVPKRTQIARQVLQSLGALP